MATIYEQVDDKTSEKIQAVLDKYFPEFADEVRVTALWDTRTKKKKFIAKICKSNDMLRFFTADESRADDGYDYVIVFDRFAYRLEGLTDEDRTRIIRHELRHIWYNPDKTKRKQQYKLCKHNCEDFYEEIELNTQEGAPRAMQMIKEVVASAYDEAEDGEE